MRSIEVEGNSIIYIKSDSMELNLELIYENVDYKTANEALRKDHLALLRTLNDLKFESGKLKTTSNRIQVLPAYDDKPKRFKVSQKFVYRDKLDMDKLSEFLDKITVDDSLNFSIAYYSSKVKTFEEDALVLALKDAKKKAGIIANAANVEIHELVSFKENNDGQPAFLRASIGDTMPDDLEIKKQITATYSIK